ncbi:LEAF RUST 10 DISEASE-RESISTANCEUS RECEPTOR-LIKE PROTEIN KINASE-like 1.5 [Aristolochia californica]|uniref:LEAF RUST 10 DISEASE-RESISTANCEUS RECEPTOR-LIKE PROTEIN KINASE-like 1.5 n=1 Tax=Aristolochia californica TaxID=171875 RepID=UPI0035E2C885
MPPAPAPLVLVLVISFFRVLVGTFAPANLEGVGVCSVVLSGFAYSALSRCGDECSCRTPRPQITDFSFSILPQRQGLNAASSCTSFPHNFFTSSSGARAFPAVKFHLSRRFLRQNSSIRFAESTCRNLSRLHLCVDWTPSNCSVTNRRSRLLLELRRLLCGFRDQSVGTEWCSSNNPTAVNDFLETGIVLEWGEDEEPCASRSNSCERGEEICSFNASSIGANSTFLCFRSKKLTLSNYPSKGSDSDRAALLTSLFVFASLLLISAIAVAIFRRKGLRLRSTAAEEDPTALFLNGHRSSSLLPPVFSYEELECATNRFDSKRKIGDGGFGSVYLAQLLDGRIVAVKKLHHRHTTKPFSNEVLILSSIGHQNLVKLHGYCCDRRGLLLVYDYVPNGTLADHLHGPDNRYRKSFLSWSIRLEMALQVATALEYLHFAVSPAVVHRDITSSNIFVEKDMKVRVGDFGLSRLLVFTDSSPTCVWTGPQGTPGYLDPDYHRSYQLTEKSDVYSFGVVLFELISGMRAVDLRREKREVALADLMVAKIQCGGLQEVLDPVLVAEGESIVGAVDAVAELAFRCVATDKDDRPDAREVVAELKRIRTCLCGSRGSANAGKIMTRAPCTET